MILKILRRNVAANPWRLALTLLSVVLGVAFVSGSFLLTDSLRAVFGDVSEQLVSGTDAMVTAADDSAPTAAALPLFDESAVTSLASLDVVDAMVPSLSAQNQIFLLDTNGEPVESGPFFTVASSWGEPTKLSPFTLVEGRIPTSNEIAIDRAQADTLEVEVGDSVPVLGPAGNAGTFVVSGLIQFGSGDAPGGNFNLFDLSTIQRLLESPGQIDSVALASAPGVSPDELVAAVSEQLAPEGLSVQSQQSLIEETNEAFGSFISVFGTILLGFATVVLFVSVFLIYNTFAILVGQRVHQIGLLRAVGATRRQVRALVIGESLLIGFLASLLGLLVGILVAQLIKSLLGSVVGSFPDTPLVFTARTVIVVFVVGIAVTVVSALGPAWRASRVSPMAAVSGQGPSPRSTRRRIIGGTAVLAVGLALLLTGMFGSVDGTAERLSLIGPGAALTFIGVALLSALFAGPVTRWLGAPVQAVVGVTGQLARGNASRNPQRTAATGSALMIGLALISGVAVLQQSVKASLDEIIRDSVHADVLIRTNQQVPFSENVIDIVGAVPEVATTAASTNLTVRTGLNDDEVFDVEAFDTEPGAEFFDADVVEGTALPGTKGLLLGASEARDLKLSVGDTMTLEFSDGQSETLTIVGLFANRNFFPSPLILDRSVAMVHQNPKNVSYLAAGFADGVAPKDGLAAVESVLAEFPQLSVQDTATFLDEANSQIDAILGVVAALLALCIVVAFIGIVNTMALSVLERTREIGLLRAVGTTRRQLRAAIRWEAMIVATFGSILGVGLGLTLGWAAVLAIPEITVVRIPWWLIIFVILGAVLGVVAAILPARRAAHLDILDAINST